MDDPLATLAGDFGYGYGQPRRQRSDSAIPPLTPEEQTSLLGQVGSGALHGLGYVGSSLSKAFGGRAIRGLLGGKPNELLSIIPFSDFANITNPDDEVHGSDLLGGDKDTPFFSAQGLGGLGLDIVTDPAMWFGGPIVKGIGKGASAAASGGAKLFPRVASTFDAAASPVRQAFRAGFQKPYRGLLGEAEQMIAPRFSAAEEAGAEAGRLTTAKAARAYGAADMLADPQGLRTISERPGAAVSPGAQRAAAELQPEFNRLLTEAQALGEDRAALPNYFPRKIVQPELDVANDIFKQTGRGGGTRHRVDILRDLAVEDANKMVADPLVGTSARTAVNDAAAAAHLVTNYGVPVGDADALAKFLHGLDPRRANLGLFSRDSIHDAMNYLTKTESRLGMLRELYPAIAEYAGPSASGSVPVKEFLNKVGLTNTGAAHTQVHQALRNLGKQVGNLDDLHLPREISNALGAIMQPNAGSDGSFTKLVKWLIDAPSNLFRGSVTSPFPSFHSRNALTSLGWIQTVLTGSPTAALEGNQMMTDLLRGGAIKGISQWPALKPMGLTDKAASEFVGNWMFSKGLTSHGAVGDVLGHSAAPSILEGIPGMVAGRKVGLEAIPEYLKGFVGKGTPSAGAAQPSLLEKINPLAMRGVGGRAESAFAPAAAGDKLSTVIEQTGRGGGALALLKQGQPLDMASALTKAAHVDYNNLTTFEREVMRRLVPFYSWAKGIVPHQIGEIMRNPGGVVGSAVKTAATVQGREPLPDYLGTGAVGSLGTTEEGKRRYLTSLGLPFEDLGDLATPSRLLGRLNPLLKFAAEQATGRQLSSGRELSSIHPLPSSVSGMAPQWVENAFANSPLSRYISTARSLTGDSPLSAASGLAIPGRLTDVDPVATRRNAIRNFAEQELLGNPNVRRFQTLTVPVDQRTNLTPEEARIFQLYQMAQRMR